MKQVLLVAELALREATRRRLVLVLLALSIIFLGFYLYGVHLLHNRLTERAGDLGLDRPGRSARVAYGSTVLFGMYLVNFLGGLMAVLSSVGAISGEVESGTIQSVAYKPVSRGAIVAGKWLGFAIVNLSYVAILSIGLLYGSRALTGYFPPNPWPSVGLIGLTVVLLLTLTILGGTIFTTLANGIGVFLLYGLGFAGGILSSIGGFTNTPLLIRLGNVSSYVMPSDALWKGASYYLQPQEFLQFGDATRGGGNPFIGTAPPEPALIVWAAVYVVLALILALLIFRRRDL
ncbi:ABC transporter permease [Deinococcus yavapaiensis]|uniref:ABC-type transport system involved in multi-copper enzyme maturation permease subunit n=1 Tax=Deinococcus yavapaiensis KR-236 TaxID=694435 RepID=A0A318S5J1_9DEIO|nr:ABC transporter permease [Deinococcus yavapaiensis]PYE52875.1 ABC-type transport system involved in multi-copper enzyme maturation permease subunit [Deinococcus yavapaiensis KR-236]